VGTVTVRGSAVVPGRPDEAALALDLETVRESAQAAYDDVARRAADLEAVLDELGVPSESRTTTGVSVREQREYDRGRYLHRGFAASSRLNVRTRDAEVAAKLLQQAVGQAGATVGGPWWSLDLENPARVEACREAAVEARRKAEAYADALGMRLAAVVDVREPGLGPRPPELAEQVVFSAAAEEHGAPVPVSPGVVDVRASIEVTFALEPA
jgi:uncharacterized protein YggE